MRRDWVEWHRAYDEPTSSLSRRLRAVQRQIRQAIDRRPPGPIQVVSLCAGQGRDLIGALADHPRRDDVVGRLVEIEPGNTAAARAAARAARLRQIEVVTADASLTDSFAGAVPADLVLACGVFGNLTDEDIARAISHLPRLCAVDATVIWTRNRRPPDITPYICQCFEKYGFEPLWQSPPTETSYGVGAHQLVGEPLPLHPGVRMFTFVGYDILRGGAPWPG